jgi:hypothetical protein
LGLSLKNPPIVAYIDFTMPAAIQRSLTPDKRIKATEITLYLALIAGIVMSFKLWISGRMFPMFPVTTSLSAFPAGVDQVIVYAMIAVLAVNCFLRKSYLNVSFLFLLWLLLMRDQNRWQAWVYMYILMMIPFIFRSKFDNGGILHYVRLMMIGVYLWSGLHKINPSFPQISFQLMVTKLFNITDPKLVEAILPFGYAVAFIEIVMAVFLYFPKTRLVGLVLAVGSHILILFFISPLGIGYNYIVVPWNLAMIAFVILGFYDTRDKIAFVAGRKFNWKLLPVLVFVWLMPVFNLFGYWDNNLSFQLYANKEQRLFVAISDGELPKVNNALSKYCLRINEIKDGVALDVNEWSIGELNVPLNHQRRLYKYVANVFCNMDIKQGEVFFLLLKQNGKKADIQAVSCQELMMEFE